MTVRPVVLICSLLLGVSASFLTACGNKDAKGLIPARNSSELDEHLDSLQSVVDSGKCAGVTRALNVVANDLASLPESVDDELVKRIESGYDKLNRKAQGECRDVELKNTTTAATTEVTTEVTTEATEPETVPEEPTVPDDTTTPQDTTTDPNGGVSPEDPGGNVPPVDPGGTTPGDTTTIPEP